MGELYEYIDLWSGDRIFTYVVVFILIICLVRIFEFGMSILIAIIIGYFVINYLNHRYESNEYTHDKIQKIKEHLITPELTNDSKEHNDVINFLFSIQDLYESNPQQYTEMVKNINYFYELYNLTFLDNTLCYTNYEMMKQFKRNAANDLMCIIISVPNDKQVHEKIQAAAVILDDIMTHDLDKISYIVDKCTFKLGYNIDTKIINYGPKAFNEYDDMFKPYSYEIF